MARQIGEIKITGTIDDITFYKMDGEYYARMKSSLTGKKFWKHKAFEGSRRSCSRFAAGNKLASRVYRMIEEEKRVYKLYCFLKKRAIALLKEGKSLEEAEGILKDYLIEFGVMNCEKLLTIRFPELPRRKEDGCITDKKNYTERVIAKEVARTFIQLPRWLIRQDKIGNAA